MKRFIVYPSIDQFRRTIKNVGHTTRFGGFDEETQKVIYDLSIPMPVIDAIGTEKIHGSNMGVCYSHPDGFWVQSRKNIITPEKDNAACAFQAYQNKDAWLKIIADLSDEHDIDLNESIISIYSEWCGGSIQKLSACSDLEKMAIIFAHFKVSPIEPQRTDNPDDEPSKWYPTLISSEIGEYSPVFEYASNPDAGIYNIMDFPTYEIDIDFNQPLLSQNKMIELVQKIIEPNSPVGQQLGKDENVGEGIVVSFLYKDSLHQFKVKGEKHSNSKVKTLKPVDNEKLQKIQDIAQKVTPGWRLEQMFNEANDTINGGEPSIKNMGSFLSLVNRDIIKEESDIIAEAGLEPKEVFKTSSTIARVWYQTELNKDAGL